MSPPTCSHVTCKPIAQVAGCVRSWEGAPALGSRLRSSADVGWLNLQKPTQFVHVVFQAFETALLSDW